MNVAMPAITLGLILALIILVLAIILLVIGETTLQWAFILIAGLAIARIVP